MLDVFLFLQCGRKERVSSSIMWVHRFFCFTAKIETWYFFFFFILFVHITLACYRWHQNMWILITVFCLCLCICSTELWGANTAPAPPSSWMTTQSASPTSNTPSNGCNTRKETFVFFFKPTCFSDININISFCLQCSIGNILPYKKQVRILMLPKDCQLISGHLISRTIYSVYPKI